MRGCSRMSTVASANVDYQRRITHVNAAFLLLTTACLAGADPAPATPMPPPAKPVVVAPAPCSTCGTCGSCVEHESLLDRLRARLHRDSCDSCAPAPCACAPAPKCAPAP